MSRTLAANQILLRGVTLDNGTADPTAGFAAAIGSLYARGPGVGTAGWSIKYGAADTAWELLRQSFAWYAVRDYGAKGDDATDDTAALQAAIDACATAGGGVVYVSPGTYRFSQLSLVAKNKVILRGAGSASILKWTFNAGAAAGSAITIGNASSCRVEDLVLDGSLLTNPQVARGNHLLLLTGTAGSVIDTRIMRNTFQNLPASSGDAIHVIGVGANLVSRFWISRNTVAGSRYGVCLRQAYEYGWVTENYLSGGDTELACVASVDTNANALIIENNEIVHTSVTVRHAVQLEGGATTFITRLIVTSNSIIGGFATTSNVRYAVIDENIQTSGAFASADSCWRIFADVSRLVFIDNTIDRDPAASVGYCMSLEKSTTTPIYVRVGGNRLINETTAGGFIQCVDVGSCSFGELSCLSSNAGASTAYGIDIQAVTAVVTNMLVGPGIAMSALAGSFKAPIRWLCNGANITDISTFITGANTDYSVEYNIGGGGGTFNGQVVRSNTCNTAVGDSNLVGGANPTEIVGMNAGVFGPQMFAGVGTPEASVTARTGSLYMNKSGGQSVTAFYKETGTGNTGWLGVGGALSQWGTGDTTVAATAVYLAPGWIAVSVATEIQIAANRPGTVRNLFVHAATAGVTAATNTYTVRKNGVNTALLVTLGNTATGDASDTSDSFTVVATDLLSIACTKSGIVGTGQANVTATFEIA